MRTTLVGRNGVGKTTQIKLTTGTLKPQFSQINRIEDYTPYDLYFVATHCSLAALKRREQARGSRPIGAMPHKTVKPFTMA
ncbi:MAG: hypothetical protein COC24_010505 [Alphaproteobacteria bacterium]|nr:hypothetical protein [Alphaproteobacteria bacterium]